MRMRVYNSGRRWVQHTHTHNHPCLDVSRCEMRDPNMRNKDEEAKKRLKTTTETTIT